MGLLWTVYGLAMGWLSAGYGLAIRWVWAIYRLAIDWLSIGWSWPKINALPRHRHIYDIPKWNMAAINNLDCIVFTQDFLAISWLCPQINTLQYIVTYYVPKTREFWRECYNLMHKSATFCALPVEIVIIRFSDHLSFLVKAVNFKHNIYVQFVQPELVTIMEKGMFRLLK